MHSQCVIEILLQEENTHRAYLYHGWWWFTFLLFTSFMMSFRIESLFSFSDSFCFFCLFRFSYPDSRFLFIASQLTHSELRKVGQKTTTTTTPPTPVWPNRNMHYFSKQSVSKQKRIKHDVTFSGHVSLSLVTRSYCTVNELISEQVGRWRKDMGSLGRTGLTCVNGGTLHCIDDSHSTLSSPII